MLYVAYSGPKGGLRFAMGATGSVWIAGKATAAHLAACGPRKLPGRARLISAVPGLIALRRLPETAFLEISRDRPQLDLRPHPAYAGYPQIHMPQKSNI